MTTEALKEVVSHQDKITTWPGPMPVSERSSASGRDSCTGASGTYYLNSASFATATSIFTDSGLTTLATDGFYKSGSSVRELSSGVLGTVATCSTCNYIYITGARSTKSDFCSGTSYVMSQQAQTTNNHNFASVTIGDVFSELPSGAGPGTKYVAYSAVNGESTPSGTTYRIAEINASGLITGLFFGGSGGSCGSPI